MDFFTNQFKGDMFMTEEKTTETYQKPVAEIVEFETKDHIAASSNNLDGASFTETIFD